MVEYTYDSWGQKKTITGSMAGNLGYYNPFRYRGYVFDEETQMYYLNSRYYYPELRRFINADKYLISGNKLLSTNMMAYCLNSPINNFDASGCSLISAIILFLLLGATSMALTGCNSQTAQAPVSEVGAAKPYSKMAGSNDRNSPNCYSYAIGASSNRQPGGMSGIYPTKWNDVYDVAKSVEADLVEEGYSVRCIEGSSAPVNANEWRIAFRVGTTPYGVFKNGTYAYDYHFMVQTNTGQWAEKHGIGGDSILWDIGQTPDTIPWTLGGVPYYDSDILYYAIGK